MSEITTQTSFHERVYERIRESIGELLTLEEAKALVERAIQEGLFKERVDLSQPIYNTGPTKYLPSHFVELVNAQVEPLVKEAIQEWIAENPQRVKAVIQEVLQDGILTAAYKALKTDLQAPTMELQNGLFRVINKIGGC